MEMTVDRRQALEEMARRAQPAYVRQKALVLVNVADGISVQDAAKVFRVSRQSANSAAQSGSIVRGKEGALAHTMSEAIENPQRCVAPYQDEATFYRQPTQAWICAAAAPDGVFAPVQHAAADGGVFERPWRRDAQPAHEPRVGRPAGAQRGPDLHVVS